MPGAGIGRKHKASAFVCFHLHWSTLRVTHEIESPWPLHLMHSHWWKRWSRSKFTSHNTWGTNGVCESKMDVKSIWIPTWHQMDHVSWLLGLRYFEKPPLGGRRYTKPGNHGTPDACNRCFVLFYHAWGPTLIETHWNSIWMRAHSPMASH